MNALTGLNQWWTSRQVRERRLLRLGGAVVVSYLLWSWLWQPAWATWRDAAQQRASATQLLQSLQDMRQEAEQWRAQAPVTSATREAAKQQLASAAGLTLQPQAQGWRVEVRDWSATQLSQWLADVAQVAHSTVTQAQMSQSQGRWQGWMVVGAEGKP